MTHALHLLGRLTFSFCFLLGAAPAVQGQQVPAPVPAGKQQASSAASSTDSSIPNSTTTLTVRSALVLIPALVTTKDGAPVFTLSAADFVVKDDGVVQTAQVEDDEGSRPLALVVVVETGGAGAAQLAKYGRLGTLIEGMVGSQPHRVAVLGFDSKPTVAQPFTTNMDAVTNALNGLRAGDPGAAIFDGLREAVSLLNQEPASARRVIVLLSETVDSGSQSNADEVLRTVSDTNTTIYSLGFSSTHAAIKNQSSKALGSSEPGPAGGCMSRSVDSGNAGKSRTAQTYDCLALLAPPLRLAGMAWMAARDGLRENAPRTVAEVSGGAYFSMKNARDLERGLTTISRQMPNRYLLSFRPSAPHVGMHRLDVSLPEYSGLKLAGRTGYWISGDGVAESGRAGTP